MGVKRRSFFGVLLSLLIITKVGAAPSIGISGGLSPLNVLQSADVYVQLVSQPYQAIELGNFRLAEIGAEFAKPPIGFSNLTSHHVGVKPLPPIPAAFFMVLAGFLCVSLVKDRKVWAAALVALLYLSYAGINAVPRLLPSQNIWKTGQLSSFKTDYTRQFENSFGRRCEVEGTRYIGLLHRLASIPDSESFNASQGGRPIAARRPVHKVLMGLRTGCVPAEKADLFPFVFTTIQNLCHLKLSPDCLAVKAGQRGYISPAFTFNYRPHGPPEIAPKMFFAS